MKIALLGYGKMGKTIEKIAVSKGHKVILRITKENAGSLNKQNLKRADVAIEFSRPETAFQNISICLETGLPVVSGTTGWLEKYDDAKKLCLKNDGTFLYASNFSIGVNIFFALNKYLAQLMNGRTQYEVSMEEIHHVEKLDYPSGTAISLAEGILDKIKNKSGWEARLEEDTGKDGLKNAIADDAKIMITSRRMDEVPGTHKIKWFSDIDELEISHVAYSREGFASGALSAAEWIIGKKGVFGMEDMLGF